MFKSRMLLRYLVMTFIIIQQLSANVVFAQDGDWIVRFRGIGIMPLDDSGQLGVDGLGSVQDLIGGGSSEVNVGSAIVPELDITYMFDQHFGLEIIAGIARHDVSLQNNGLSTLVRTLTSGAAGAELTDGFKIFDTWVLPPTLTLQYHFLPERHWRPYAGLGVNYTVTLGDDATDALETAIGGTVDVNTSNGWTWAVQAGFDFDISDDWFMNFDVKYIDIDTEASLLLEGGPLANTRLRVRTDISPLVFGIGLGTRF